MMKNSNIKRQGFSLLELAVVLTIISVIIAGGLTLSSAKTQQIKVQNTYDEMQEIVKAIAIYVNKNGCLPHPVITNPAVGTATFGREPTTKANCLTAAGVGTGAIIAGTVPFYSLGLPDEYGSDENGVRYHYAVTDRAVETGYTNSVNGAITVNDDGGTLISNAVTYVLVSFGKTSKGGKSAKTGADVATCDANEKDGENCDGDAIFIDGTFYNGETTASLYDDILIWKTKEMVTGTGSGRPPIPLEVKNTTLQNSGNFNDGGGNLGYQKLRQWINGNGCPLSQGYEVCTYSDIARFISTGGVPPTNNGWVLGEDNMGQGSCASWESETVGDVGNIWEAFSYNKLERGCETLQRVMCCKWK